MCSKNDAAISLDLRHVVLLPQKEHYSDYTEIWKYCPFVLTQPKPQWHHLRRIIRMLKSVPHLELCLNSSVFIFGMDLSF